MKVYTLSGKSGTGKSFQAINLCKELDIEGIIDDGLFIYQNRVEAGISAKRQPNTVSAIKTALFTKTEHRDSVVSRIASINPDSMLIIGTSDRMVDKIIARLSLPRPYKRIYINDITTDEERDIADKQRHIQGKHVIPAPTLQLKRDFGGYFLDPLRIFKGINVLGKAQYAEKTVVRPTFSYMGEFYISDTVLTDIAHCVAKEIQGVSRVVNVYENTLPDSLAMEVGIEIYGQFSIWDSAIEFQQRLSQVIEQMTAFNIIKIDVEVKGVTDNKWRITDYE